MARFFCRYDFPRMRDLLRTLKGNLILSVNDTPETRSLFKGFYIDRVATIYSSSKLQKKVVVFRSIA